LGRRSGVDAINASYGTCYGDTCRKIFVGQNINADEKWDICLESEFDTLEDVKAYAVHPAHVAAAGILKEAKQDRACTDYIF
jgi:hypothetical protein